MQTPMRKYRILAQQSRRCHIYLHVKKKYPDKRVLVGVKHLPVPDIAARGII